MAGYKVKLELISDTTNPEIKQMKRKINSGLAIAMMRIGTESQGMARRLAPYKTGTLRRGIQQRATSRMAEFGVNLKIIPYARIREFGGVITPKRAKFLTFKVGGRWVRTKRVVQTGANGGRGYLRPTFDFMRQGRALDIIKEEINYSLGI